MARPLKRNLVGLRFGRLAIVARAGSNLATKQALWLCRCDCGNEVVRAGGGLNRGTVNSCGCIVAENNRRRLLKHGMAKGALYRVWRGMINRCHNENQPHYERYGGRGIYVCDEWRKSFSRFYADMGDRPVGPTGKPYTIERINNDGPYAPDNCKWATVAEQVRNKRPRRRRGA